MKNIKEKKEFKIVKILDEYDLIINGGKEHGIKLGDEFQILDKEGSKVIDPETQEVIGQLDLIKATVKVTELQERMCICSSRHTVKLNSPFSNLAITAGISSIADSLAISEREKLNVDLTQVTGGKRKSNEKIRLGDTARLIKSTE